MRALASRLLTGPAANRSSARFHEPSASSSSFAAAEQISEVRLELGGGAEVLRQQGGEASRFRGRQVTLYFGQGRLQRVAIEGEAELWARLKEQGRPAALNHVKGEKLEVQVAEDNTFEMHGSAGTYYPPPEE